MASVVYLTVDQVLEYHHEALVFGGIEGVRSEQLLASAVFQAQQSAFGEDAYPTVAAKAAAYCFFIVENHPFLDANKRTGAAAMLAFLDLNGLRLDQTDDDIAAAVESLAAGAVDQSQFFAWVERHVRDRTKT